MTQFYLITGFLGAGKTTFLKEFVRLLGHRRLYLIINEFGKEGVDGTLLQEMNIALAEINNGSIFCACRLDKFEESLHTALAANPDIIIAEASGLADPTNVRRVAAQFPNLDYKGSICLADAVRLPKLYKTATVCQKQLAVASLVLLNKTDVATAAECDASKAVIAQANPAAQICATQFGQMQADWLPMVTPVPDLDASLDSKDITLQKACLCVSSAMSKDAMTSCLAQLCESTYRIKGFVQLVDGTFLVSCTGTDIQITPWQGAANGKLVLLAGKGMPLRRAVQQALRWYPEFLTWEKEHD